MILQHFSLNAFHKDKVRCILDGWMRNMALVLLNFPKLTGIDTAAISCILHFFQDTDLYQACAEAKVEPKTPAMSLGKVL